MGRNIRRGFKNEMWGCDCRHRVGDTLLLISQEVSLINTDPILCQESSMLLGKSLLVMVFLLLHDIAYDHILVAQAVAESSILSSPASEIREVRVFLHPFATTALHALYKRGQRQV